ncbi:MAG: tetratricopeptide repeat protein [Thermoflexales bacterium]|nr:tetratricopeptide repeat protein [Thermoflexales bacterium]
MNDTILLAMPDQELSALVGKALKLCRDGDVTELGTSPLAAGGLVEDCFLSNEPISPDGRGQALMSVLRWAVDRLRPAGAPSWTDYAWQRFHVLHAYYINSDKDKNPYTREDPDKNPTLRGELDKKTTITLADLAAWMYVQEPTVYQRRQEAVEAVGKVLREEIAALKFARERKAYALADRYARHLPNAQLLLRIAAVFRHFVSIDVLHHMADKAAMGDIQHSVLDLATTYLLVSNEQGTSVMVHPEARPYLLSLLSPEERQAWQRAAGNHYEEQGDYVEAAHHLHQANAAERAADMLIAHAQDAMRDMHVEELYEGLAEFRRAELGENTWARLKIVAGQVAELIHNFDAALAEYGGALQAGDARTRAEAYYRRAKVLEGKNVDEALAHYDEGVALLEEVAPGGQASAQDRLLTEMYIHRAFIFLQDSPDLERAEMNLRRAEALVQRSDKENWADLHNAWGELYNRREDYPRAVEHRMQAWVAATALRDNERMMKMAYNLGMDYAYQGQHERALEYLEQGKDLASKMGNQYLGGVCHKGIGNCYFFQERYQEAIVAYQKAYTNLVACKNRDWQACICHDLAEAYARLGDAAQAERYFREGLAIAQEANDQGLLGAFQALAQELVPGDAASWPLEECLNERQQQALAYVKEHGAITNRGYRELTGVAQRQAARDLIELVERGIFKAVGLGRATRYELD